MKVLDQLLRSPLHILSVLSILALAGAYTSEYGFGLHPCHLCLWQRVPYAVVVGSALLTCRYWKHLRLRLSLLWLWLLTFIAEAALAFYHVGVEQHWWVFESECSGSGDTSSVDALRDAILGAALVRCDQPAFMLLGLSMAGWNVLYALMLAGIAGYALFNRQPAPDP
jgi:disulfide bond formation protein DsbB